MYFVEIDVIFFARLYCMITQWRVDKKNWQKNKAIEKKKRRDKQKSQYVSFIFLVYFWGDKSLHADRGFGFTRIQMINTVCLFLHLVKLSYDPSSE